MPRKQFIDHKERAEKIDNIIDEIVAQKDNLKKNYPTIDKLLLLMKELETQYKKFYGS